jgi:hypothetical protein
LAKAYSLTRTPRQPATRATNEDSAAEDISCHHCHQGLARMAQPKFTKEIVEAAIEGFEAQKRRIDAQIAELRALGSDAEGEPSSGVLRKKAGRRRISAAGRAAIAEAQRKRWAAKKAAPPSTTAPKKHKLSAAGRKAIAEAQKKRWAMKKATAKAA